MENYYTGIAHSHGGSKVQQPNGRSSKPTESGGRHEPSYFPGLQETSREKRSRDNLGFVSRDRGSDYANPSWESNRSFRPNTSNTSSTSSNFGMETPSTHVSKRWMTTAYKNITRKEPNEKTMELINGAVQMPSEKRNAGNETRCIEKLKLHLIKQNRDKDARRLVELYQKLKGMSVPKNREGIVAFLYAMFDKEATRTIMEAQARKTTQNEHGTEVKHAISSHKKTMQSEASDGKSDMVNNAYSTTTSEGYKSHVVTHASGSSISPAYISNAEDIDHTPIPCLEYQSDALLSHDINSFKKIPTINKTGNVPNKDHFDKANPWGPLSHLQETQRVDSYSVLNSVSKISKCSGEFNNRLPSSTAFIGSTPNIFSSTPMEAPAAYAKQKQLNFRKSNEHPNVTLRSHGGNLDIHSDKIQHSFINLRAVEKELTRDIVFILQGIDGSHIKFNSKGKYEILLKQPIHKALRLKTLTLCEVGYCFRKIRMYCDSPTTGLMTKGLKQAIEKELQEYYRLLAVIQGKVQQTVVDTPLSEDLPSHAVGHMTINQLLIWLVDCRPRLQLMHALVKCCQKKRGGQLCSAVYDYSYHGDKVTSGLTISLLCTITKPLYVMLSQWILYGELEDPFNEFFIAGNSACKKEQLWHHKYRIRPEMLPSFISLKQAEKIMAIGKNINFLRDICNNNDGFDGRNEVKLLLETSEVESLFRDEHGPIHYAIETSYKTTSEKVLKVLRKDSQLLVHLRAIKKYLLLGQGDFIQYFLELIQEELDKSASKLFNHNISAILEAAVRATNAQFESEDVLSRLDTRILPTSDKDIGWDVFCLDYKAHGPIGTVLTEDVMNGYNKLFNGLWRTKRIESILSHLWKNQAVLFKHLRVIPEIAVVLHRSQLLISEMIHFVHQTQYYIMFEATECAWEKLIEDVNKASDLDEVIRSHKKFLETIFMRSLLDAENRGLLNQLRGIFDSVHELKTFLQKFHDQIEIEVTNRKKLEPNTKEKEDAQKQFFSSYVMQAKGKIETLYTTTQDLVRTFLIVLNRQQDLTLQCLSFRLDFNEYYHLKDSRLTQPLTLQHRRLSSNAFTPANMSNSFTGLSGSALIASTSIPESAED